MLFKRSSRASRAKPAPSPRPVSVGPSIITRDVVIEGNLITGGELQIDGTIHGDVRAQSAVIDQRGVIHGEVIAEEIGVRGKVIGPLRGAHVRIFAGGHVEGNVVSESVAIETGAHVEGQLRRSDDPLALPAGYDEPQAYPGHPQHQLGVYDDHGYREVDIDPSRKAATPEPPEVEESKDTQGSGR